MPPKKQIQLQIPVETQDDWQDFISKEGLAVMDVYSAWCGPCKAVQGLFRRLKNEIGDALLRFGLAKSDTIESLEPYRDKSMPTFLMYASGELVAVVRGALGPLLERTIKDELAKEHQAIEEGRQRVSIVDEALGLPDPTLEEDEEQEEEDKRPDPVRKQFTVLVIKPDAVQAGKVDEIVERVESQGLQILAQEEHQFSREEAAEFYKQHEGSDHFEELIEFMCSGPCMTLVLTKGDTGEGVVEDIRDLIGPKDVDLAKEEAPNSIRAAFGTDTTMNAVHASDSHEMAARELAFFLPKFKAPWVPGTEPPIERTLALIKPDALAQHRDAILSKISEAGFEVAYQKELTLTKEQAEEFYKKHEGKDFFDSLTTHMSSGPMLALCLAREDAISEWRRMLTSVREEEEEGEEEGEGEGEGTKEEGEGAKEGGEGEEAKPKSAKEPNLREQFAVEGSVELNPLHGSDDPEIAAKEVEYFFPVEHTLCAIKPSHFSEREAIIQKIKESGFQVSLSDEATLTKEMAEQLYNEKSDKDYFEDLVTMMTSGPSMFMVLSKPDAVMGWRAIMGHADPGKAKEEDPDSLRAIFGKSFIENAVHGSADPDNALQEIEQVFGPVKIGRDGSVEKLKPEAGEKQVTFSEEGAAEQDKPGEPQAEETPASTGAEAGVEAGEAGEKPSEGGEDKPADSEEPQAAPEAATEEKEGEGGETQATEAEEAKNDVTELELEKDKDETKEQDHTPKEEEAPEAAPVNEIPTDGGQTNTTIEETPAA